jgi:hypothetical protein
MSDFDASAPASGPANSEPPRLLSPAGAPLSGGDTVRGLYTTHCLTSLRRCQIRMNSLACEEPFYTPVLSLLPLSPGREPFGHGLATADNHSLLWSTAVTRIPLA